MDKRQLMQAGQVGSSDDSDGSESQVGTLCESRQDGFLLEKFHHFWAPLGIGLLFEFLLVLAMWRWRSLNWPELRNYLEYNGIHEEQARELLRPGDYFPVVFLGCILGRLLTMTAWKKSFLHGKDCHYSAVFMYFNCVQWIVYIALYFWLFDNLKMLTSVRTLQSEIRFLPYNMTPPEHRYPCQNDPFWRDQEGMSCADYAVNTSEGLRGGKIPCGIGRGEALSCPVSCNLTCSESPGLERFRRCTSRPGETLHSCTTRGAQVGQWEACTKPYNVDECFGYVFLLAEDQKNLVKCCVQMTFSKKLPTVYLWKTRIQAFDLGIDDVLAMCKWIAVLVMTWDLQESPFLAPSHASKEFTNRVWLDILDAFMFISLFQEASIQAPADGLSTSGVPLPGGEDKTREAMFFFTWLIAAFFSVLSPIVYTWFRDRETKASADEQKKQLLTQDTLLKELEERIRLLDKEGAQMLLEKGMQLTEEDIAKQEELDTRVLVWPQDDEYNSFFKVQNPGFARRERNQATYNVEYDWGDVEEGVTLERLQPTENQPRADRAQLCSGWCETSYLCPDDDQMSAMQRRAHLIDAYRSFFTLELPFFCWRLWIHWGDTSGVEPHLLTMKNLMFGVADLLTILACGNEDATIFGVAPAAIISRMIAGTVTGAVKAAGPGALMKRASGAALRAISANQAKLEMKLAFLRQERYLARMSDGEEVARRFDGNIERLTAELEDEKGFLKHFT